MATPTPVSRRVAVGGEARCLRFATLPSPSPAPSVVARHLDPIRPSPLPVRLVADRDRREDGVIAVVPTQQPVHSTDHYLTSEPDRAARLQPAIDLLVRTAAAGRGAWLIVVVLTSLGSDGAAGAPGHGGRRHGADPESAHQRLPPRRPDRNRKGREGQGSDTGAGRGIVVQFARQESYRAFWAIPVLGMLVGGSLLWGSRVVSYLLGLTDNYPFQAPGLWRKVLPR